MQMVYHRVVSGLLALCVLMISITGLHAAEKQAVATVGYTRGVVVARADEKSVRLVGVGSKIHVGELIMTGEGSYVEMTFTDDSKIVIRPNSQFVIEAYHFDPANPENDVFKARLIQGGYRGYSGSIGKRYNPDAYRVDTHVAYIGIRGTIYNAYVCKTEKRCQDDMQGKQYKPGLYMSVRNGQVIMASEQKNQLQQYSAGTAAYTNSAPGTVLEVMSSPPTGLDFVVPDNPAGCVVN